MLNRLNLLLDISPLVLIPYLVVMLFVLTYFVHQKYQVRIRIRNVPYSTIFNIDLDKVKKNLEIQSMVYNFVLVIIMIEMLTNSLWGITQIIGADLKISHFYVVKEVRNQTILNQTMEINRLVLMVSNFSTITLSLILPLHCLFLIVLRRAFINLPYKEWVRKYMCVHPSSVCCYVSNVIVP